MPTNKKPIYVSNPNDPRLKAYQDSLKYHNTYVRLKDKVFKVKVKKLSDLSALTREVNENNPPWYINSRGKQEWGKHELYSQKGKGDEGHKVGLTNYKKPEQPYVYQKVKEEKKKEKKPIITTDRRKVQAYQDSSFIKKNFSIFPKPKGYDQTLKRVGQDPSADYFPAPEQPYILKKEKKKIKKDIVPVPVKESIPKDTIPIIEPVVKPQVEKEPEPTVPKKLPGGSGPFARYPNMKGQLSNVKTSRMVNARKVENIVPTFVSGAKSVKQYRGDENLPEAKNGMKKGCGCKHSKSKYKYGTGAITIPEGSAIVTANKGKNKQALMAYKKGNYKLLNNIIDDMPEDNVDKAKKGIKNTYRKYKFQEGVNSVNADEDDTWIRKILNFEATKGSSEGKGLSNFGYNDWKKLGHSRPPESIDEAVEYYKKDYLPKVKNYPVEVRKRIGDYIFNTGRSPEDLLLHASGKLSLKELNSTGTSKDKWETNKGEIEKMFSDPNFISKLDKSRDDVYKTTKTTNGQPNSAYNNSWKDRVNLFNDNASSSTNNAPVSQNTQTQQTQGPVNSASSQTPVPSTQNTPQGNSKVTEIKGNLSTDPITKETYQENFVLGGPKKYGKEMSLDKAKNLYGLTDEQFETAYGKNKKSDTYRIESGRRQAIKDKNVYYNVAGKVDKNGELLKYSSGYKTQPNEGEKPKETPVKLPPPPNEIPPPTTKTPPDDTGKRKEYVTMPSMAEIAARSSILGQGIEGIPENYLKLGRYNYASQLDRTLRENAIAANTAKENIRDVSGGSAGSYLSNVANITGKRFDANAGAVTQDTLARQDILNKNVDLGNTEAQVNTGLKNQYAELRGKARSNYNDQLVALGQRIDSATETAQEMSNQRGADDQRMQVLKDLGLNYEYQNVNGLMKLVPKVPVNTPPTTTGTPDAVSKKGLKKVKTYKRR